MRIHCSHSLSLIALTFLSALLVADPVAAEHILARAYHLVQEATYTGTEPVTGADCAVEELAENIDWLEHYIDTYGSIVAKAPDIWGEARLTKYRDEYERIMFRELTAFEVKINASIAQSDSAFLAQALALSAAAGGTPPALANTIATAQVPQTVKAGSVTAVLADAGAAPFRTADNKPTFSQFGVEGDKKISLEPVLELDQLSRFLDHLHELRRVNEGDDTSDSPGYSLNLVRIPVSILPGKLTRTGFGAEVTVTCTPVITDDLMPTTFHNLAVNDMVDLLGLPLVRITEGRLYGTMPAAISLPLFQESVQTIESAYKQTTDPDRLSELIVPAIRRIVNDDYLRNTLIRTFQIVADKPVTVPSNVAAAATPGTQDSSIAAATGGAEIAYSPAIKNLQHAINNRISAALRTGTATAQTYQKDRSAQPRQEDVAALKVFSAIVDSSGVRTLDQVASQERKKPLNAREMKQRDAQETAAFYGRLIGALKSKNSQGVANELSVLDVPSMLALRDVVHEVTAELRKSVQAVPTGRARRALNPINPTSVVSVIGLADLIRVSQEFEPAYSGKYIRWNGGRGELCEKRVDLLDAQRFLQAELEAAHELLSQPEYIHLFAEFASPCSGLARQIRGGHLQGFCQPLPSVEEYRHRFFQRLHECCRTAVAASPAAAKFPISVANYEVLPTPTPSAGNSMSDGPDFGPDVSTSIDAPAASSATAISAPKTTVNDEAHDTVEALAWAMVVESALLNDRLNLDVRKIAKSKEVPDLDTPRDYLFFLPETVMAPGTGLEDLQGEFQEATRVFKRYVEVRWPIHVFAIDPREQDQNVADVSARKRELQFALALGFVTGQIGVNSLTQFSRELQTQIETIALNRTVVGFGHGDDTFGWRFQPRVQGLYVPNTIGVLRETLCGVSRDYDLRHRQLEPGQRDCTAIVLMPSFVPYADFDVRTNWYKLTNPKNSVLTMKEAVRLSRAVTAMRNSRAQCSECAYLYRDNEVSRLMKRVDQLDQELPLQTMRTLVPYENTLGGFEMFNTGVTDLSPELIGWYGAPGVYISDNGCNQFRCGCTQKCQDGGLAPLVQECVKKGTQDVLVEVAKTLPICEGEGTTLFLVGDNFSVHDTRVIAGGVCIPHVQLVSRQIMRVTIPSCVQTVHLCENGCVNEYVAVYVATPYGVTNHLHVPVHRVDSTTEQEPGTDCSAAPTPCAVDGPTAVPQLAAAERSLIRLPPTRRAQLPSRNELQLAPPAPTTQPAGGDDGGAFRGAQNENRWRVQLAAASVPIEPELSPVGRPTSTTVGPLPAVRVALQSPPSDTADQLLQELRTLTTQLKDERAAIQAALEREGNAAALAGQSVVNVNVRQPADRGLSLCDGTQFPCFHRMFVSARECWRNVRDELPCN